MEELRGEGDEEVVKERGEEKQEDKEKGKEKAEAAYPWEREYEMIMQTRRAGTRLGPT
ncbi:hypothetical protein K435DRAFT_778116 [Dendrothele bispora CBS 962.96]|uniref:Uncharacterized protein n=1 Tax=Dendrothele bispora (strain CBS 962.96) TaxID=1314807 RepID=A0A4S8M528_DENBC|nr:hypothetical protein K435DRAFT_778116 [Dendrothele bispora CBS 962.96]